MLLLNEFDFDPDGLALERFQENFLAVGQGGADPTHAGDPAVDTADFCDGENGPGNLRVDHALPSRGLRVVGAGVFWPELDDPLSRLTGVYDPTYTNGFPSSDHRMVWVDVAVGKARR